MTARHTPPFSPDQVADARRLAANLHHFLHLAPDQLAQMRQTAWTILCIDRDARRRTASQAAAARDQPGDAA